MPFALPDDVTIFDESLSKLVTVGAEGLSKADLDAVREWIPKMIAGTADTLTLVPAEGIEATEDLNLIIFAQLEAIIAAQDYEVVTQLNATGKIATMLHIDAVHSPDGSYVTTSGIRVNFNDGQDRGANIPDGVDAREYDPLFLFGRKQSFEPLGETTAQTYDGLQVSAVVNMARPVWNIFRNYGDTQGQNIPLVHSVIPRKLAEKVLDPQARFSPLRKESRPGYIARPHDMELDGEITTIEDSGTSPQYVYDNKPIGPVRKIRAVDFMLRGVEFPDF